MNIDRKASRLRFVYPFVFDAESFDGWVSRVTTRELTISDAASPMWEPRPFPDEDLVAHVADYLNTSDASGREMAGLFQLTEPAREHRDAVGARGAWTLRWRRREIAFSLEGAELALFRAGVGFITLSIRPHGDDPNSWLDFIHAFRFGRGRRAPGISVEWATGFDQVTKTKLTERHVPSWASPEWSEGDGKLFDLVEYLLETPNPEIAKRWARSVFIPGQLLPFSALFVDDAEADEVRRFRFQMQRSLPAAQPVAPPSGQVEGRGLLEYGEQQWFVCSLDGGGFLGANTPRSDFFRVTLPEHLDEQYFLLFLIALHQRYAMMRLSSSVCEAALLEGEARFHAFRSVQWELLQFTARSLFKQAMQRENHHVVYACWQDVFELERLYGEVRDEVHDLDAEARLDHEARMEKAEAVRTQRIQLIGLVVGFPALVLTFMGINLRHLTDGRGIEVGVAVAVAVASVVLGAAVGLLAGGSRRTDRS